MTLIFGLVVTDFISLGGDTKRRADISSRRNLRRENVRLKSRFYETPQFIAFGTLTGSGSYVLLSRLIRRFNVV